MDDNRFDDLTKSLAAATSRRQVFKRLGSTLAAAISGVVGIEQGTEAATCANSGNSCNAQKCCKGSICVGKPGSRVCCPQKQACGSNTCCPTCFKCSGNTCVADTNQNGKHCDDGNPCTNNDVCRRGICAGTPIAGCVQCARDTDCGNIAVGPCQEAFCSPAGTCNVRSASDGTGCNDNNPCTTNDVCTNGVCAGTPVANCTTCDSASQCPQPPDQCQQATCINHVCGIANKTNGTACNDGNACTTNDACTNGVCAGTLTAGCVQCSRNTDCSSIPVDQCHEAVCGANGACVVQNRANGTSCDDGNPCTSNDVCTAGVCAGTEITGCVSCTSPGTCPQPADQCQQPTCQNNICGTENKPNDSPCDDGDVCTLLDTCHNGTCQAGLTKPCDQCLSCQDVNGVATCAPDSTQIGKRCNDQNACTENDVCTAAGICVGTPVDCDDGNECTTDTCDPATGCVHTPLTGTICDTGNLCTADTCDNGVCQEGALSITCPPCQVCDPGSGTCRNLTDDTPCNADNNACTVDDSCQSGICVPGSPMVCEKSTNPCAINVCNPLSGECALQPANPGSVCRAAGTACEGDALCSGTSVDCPDNPLLPEGTPCRGTTDACDLPAVCSGASNQCPANAFVEAGVVCRTAAGDCDLAATCSGESAQCPDNGFKTSVTICRQPANECDVAEFCTGDSADCPANEFKANDTPCNLDADLCTLDTCQKGVCTAGPNKTCSASTDPCKVNVCDPTTGDCISQNLPNNAPCEDGDLCTIGDSCQGGTCQPGAALVCSSSADPCKVNICDPGTGTCAPTQNAANGTACNDGNPCTVADTCLNGTCQPGSPKICPAPPNQCQVAVCDPITGSCVNQNAPNGTACNDNNVCTSGDVCTNGACAGTPIANCCTANSQCIDGNVCTSDACVNNVCVFTPIAGCCTANNQCNDNNACTTDACVNNVCVFTPIACPSGEICQGGNCCVEGGGTCTTTTLCCSGLGNCNKNGRCKSS
jgi:hypothetical protein